MVQLAGQMSIFDFLTDEPVQQLYLLDSIIKEQILRGSGFVDGKKRIYRFFSEKHSTKEKSQFLNNEYGLGGWTLIYNHNRIGFHNHDAKGISLEFYEEIEGEKEVHMPWNRVSLIIDELIESGEYFQEKVG